MKKLLLTLLLLFTLGLAAQATELELFDVTPANSFSKTGSASATESDLEINGYTFKVANVWWQKNTSNSYMAFKKSGSPVGYMTLPKFEDKTITKICLFLTTAVSANNSKFDIYVNDTKIGSTITWSAQGTWAEFEVPSEYQIAGTVYKIVSANNNNQIGFGKLKIEYGAAATAEKVTLDEANLEVKAGESVLENEAELDANTTISWKYNYTGEVANPDITYSYSVDGGEEVEGNEYTYAGEKDVVLTVKATSTNSVSKTVKLLKKYPTVCPEPVFNVEDGAKVYAGQAVTVSCEGADIEWTVNDATITGTSYTITEEVGTQLTFYALASIEGRNPSTGNIETLTSEKEITVTVVEATEATFNFNEKNYGLTRFTAGSDYEPTLTEISEGIVKIDFTGNFRLWGASAGDQLRVMSGATFTISVPEDYYIESITFDGSTSKATPDKGSLSSGNWNYNGFASAVKFTCSGRVDIDKATIKYAKLTPTLEGDPTINVTHASKKGVLIVEYSFKIANHNGKPVEVTANVAGMEHIAFVDATPANAPARVAGESTTVSGTLRAEHADLVDASNLNVNLKATLDGQEFFTRQATVTNTTGIEDVTVEGEGEAEYFNLQGLRVAQPEAGQLYIKRQAGKAVKVRF